jgi:hypothetical protein
MLETEKSPGWETGAEKTAYAKFNGSKHSSQDYIEQFRDFARKHGFELPAEIVADGKVHRFGLGKVYAYALQLDGDPNGWVQDLQGGKKHEWKANGLNPNLNRALALAAQGFPVFPCDKEDKSPLTPHGFKDATTNEGVIHLAWFGGAYPEALIGVATGEKSGIAVVDVDRHENSADGFESLRERGIELPGTFSNQTPSNGEHHFYQRPAVDAFPSRTNAFPGVDIKVDKGYVIWHRPDVPPNLRELINPWPKELDEAIEREEQAHANPSSPAADHAANHSPQADIDEGRMRRSGLAALKGRAADLAKTPKGLRNRSLYEGVCYLGKLIHHGYHLRRMSTPRFGMPARKMPSSRMMGPAHSKRRSKAALRLQRTIRRRTSKSVLCRGEMASGKPGQATPTAPPMSTG